MNRLLPKKILLMLVAAIFASGTSFGDFSESPDPDNTVVITGRHKEATMQRQNGQSILIKPNDASRFDTLTHLKRESSMSMPETGRISPSGFVVPKVRGQDASLTDVYVEDVLLQDPYSGLPLVEDIDLRAFGSLEIHQGVPPADVMGLNPIGTLRYRFQPTKQNSATTGLRGGVPFGLSTWWLGIYHGESSDVGPEIMSDARLYLRSHQTNGRYSYYSDEGSPYNERDDTVRRRVNNDQRSSQAVPLLRYQVGSYRFQCLGWIYRAERGLATLSAVVPSSARENADGHLGHLQAARDFSNIGIFKDASLSLGVTDTRDLRDVSDPGRIFLGSAEQSKMRVQSRRVQLQGKGTIGVTSFFVGGDAGSTAVDNHLGNRLAVDLKRQSDNASVGVRVDPQSIWVVELKAAKRVHVDHLSGDGGLIVLEGEDIRSKKVASSNAFGGSLALGREDIGGYVQSAIATRLPSLIEEFGNGSSIRPNGALSPESIHHHEIGAFAKGLTGRWRLGLAGYEDVTENKIVFVPVLANGVKAKNVRQTAIKGVDVRAEAGVGDTSVYISYSRLFPYDKTRGGRKILPGIAEHIFVGELEERLREFTVRWLARYRSTIYRDLGNSVELPGAWINDASLDYHGGVVSKDDLRVGLSVRNVFDVTSVEISAPDTKGSRGRTAFSDVSGYPLPGRQWILSLTFTI
jgi:TonB dependent receptor